MVYNWYSGELSKLATEQTLAPGYEGHIYALASPVCLPQSRLHLGSQDASTEAFENILKVYSKIVYTQSIIFENRLYRESHRS